MQFDDVLNLTAKDFVRIHKSILESKLTECTDSDKQFVITYGKDVYDYKYSSPLFRDWLFNYEYSDLIKGIRLKNETFKKTLFSIDEK
jgi:hypothetical protein